MHITTLIDACKALDEILSELNEQSEVRTSPNSQQRINLALQLIQIMHRDAQEFSDNYTKICRELLQLKIDELGEDGGDYFRRILAKYEWIYQAGGDAELIYRVAKAEGIELIFRLKILRTLFPLSLMEAQNIAKSVEETTSS